MKPKQKKSSQPSQQQPIYTFDIERLSHEGRGIAHYGSYPDHPAEKKGKKVFIAYALPGETVRAKITNVVKRLEEGECVELLSEASALRVAPICKHFGVCGGCNMQHIHPDEQIRIKQEVLQSHLEHFAGLQPQQWLAPLRSTRTDYRRKARIGVRYFPAQDQLVVGFRERQSNRLTQIQECPVLDQQMGQHLPQLSQVLSQLQQKQAIGHVELAMGDHEIAMLVRHTAPLAAEDINQLLDFSRQQGWQLYLQPVGPESLIRIDAAAAMRLHYVLPKFDVEFSFSPLDFTQVNSTINPQMVNLACELLDLKAGERVLDLFCGLGNFSLPLARCVGETGQVIAVEGSQDMVQRGTENARQNALPQVQFYMQDLTQDFSQQAWAAQGFDAILLDPPRAGAEEVIRFLPQFAASRIVYVSCNPATLARDAKVLAEQGYHLAKAGVMDMFTHTGHVESIALFEQVKLND